MFSPLPPFIGGLCIIFLAITSPSHAEFKLEDLQTSGCIGPAIRTSTASTSSAFSTTTGKIELAKGSYWQQVGAVWEVSTDTEGIAFNNLSGPKEAQEAFKFSKDKRTITFRVPFPTPDQQYAMTWMAEDSPTSKSKEASSIPKWNETSFMARLKEALSTTKSQSSTPLETRSTWSAGACTISSFSDKTVTCNGRLQVPPLPTVTVCACPNGIMLYPSRTGDSRCGFTKGYNEHSIETNRCPPGNRPISKRQGQTSIPEFPDPAHPMITHAPKIPLVGARYRQEKPQTDLEPRAREDSLSLHKGIGTRLLPRQDAGKVNIIVKGIRPCTYLPPTPTGPEYKANSIDAFRCRNHKISANKDTWTSYDVNSYMTKVLNEPGPGPSEPGRVNGAALIFNDVNPHGGDIPRWQTQTNDISCGDVQDGDTGSLISIQRFIAYQAVVNYCNWLFNIKTAVEQGADDASLRIGTVIQRFYSVDRPGTAVANILSIVGPFFGMFAGIFAPIAPVSGLFGGLAGIFGQAANIAIVNSLQPEADKRWDQFANDTEVISKYVNVLRKSLEEAYNQVLGPNTSRSIWTGPGPPEHPMKDGVFGTGFFANTQNLDQVKSRIPENMVRFFLYKAINFAWTDSACFIVYVPYGQSVKLPDGSLRSEGIDEDYCKNELKMKEDIGNLTICEAIGGMARLYMAGGAPEYLSKPKSFDEPFDIYQGDLFSVAGAIRGSIASWREGDFGYEISDPYRDLSDIGTLPEDQAKVFAALEIREDIAGIFNVPVCQVNDLRAFPPASDRPACLNCFTLASVGGKPGSTVKFRDKISAKLNSLLRSKTGLICSGVPIPSCESPCPSDTEPYVGTSAENLIAEREKRKEEDRKKEAKHQEEVKKKYIKNPVWNGMAMHP